MQFYSQGHRSQILQSKIILSVVLLGKGSDSERKKLNLIMIFKKKLKRHRKFHLLVVSWGNVLTQYTGNAKTLWLTSQHSNIKYI